MSMFDSPVWVGTLLHNAKARRSVCNQQFEAFDADKNGQLEEGELASLVSSVCAAMKVAPPSGSDLHGSLERFDRSHSGGLTPAEFSRFFEHFLRSHLPFMRDQAAAAEQASAAEPAAVGQAAPAADGAKFQPSTAPGSIRVSVCDMAGATRWGPYGVGPAVPISELCAHVSRANGSKPLRLLQGVRVLEPTALLSSITDQPEVLLSMVVETPDALVADALRALELCPDLSGADGEASVYVGTDAHAAWRDVHSLAVTARLEQLAAVVVGGCGGPARDLAVRCLQLQSNCDICDRLGAAGLEKGLRDPELHPDELTFAAARLLPLVVEEGDGEIMRVITSWLGRLFCFHGRLTEMGDGPTIDAPGTCSNMYTVVEMVKNIPSLVQGTRMHSLAKGKLKSCACAYMSFIENHESYNIDTARVKQDHEWKLGICYDAIMSLTDAAHPSGNLNNPWWARRGYEFPAGGREDEEWMDEYMYKRPK